ncbi:hypothetical protein RCCGE510_20329 [Rhizobium sp. CCGE 510]|nr:hypothetical protein RCCGE510_20329 [Rhizobium sp. CCGE 510]
MLTTLRGHCAFHRKPFHATDSAATRWSLVYVARSESGSRKFIQLRLHATSTAGMRIVLHRIAATNPSIDKTTPNLQARRPFENEDGRH